MARGLEIVLLPGLACDAGLWRAQHPALAARHRVTVTDVHTRCATLPEMAATLLREHPGRPVLIGSSMGGMIAMEAAIQAPQRVRALGLLSTTAQADTPQLVQLRRDAIVLFEQGRTEAVLRENVPLAFHRRVPGDSPLVAEYLQLVLRAGAAQLVAQNRAVLSRRELRPALPSIACPTLVLCGDDDQLTPPERSREIADAIPGARLEVVADAGHLMTLEQPERVNALLLDWLDRLPGA